jgi:hypothetical protein
MRKARKGSIIGVMAVVLAIAACGGNPPPGTDPTAGLSAQGRAAYEGTRVVKALDVLRDVAVDAERQSPKLLSTDNTRRVVRYHESAVKAIGAVPSGWQAVVTTGLNELAKEVPAAEWRQLEPFANLVRTLIAAVAPPGGQQP